MMAFAAAPAPSSDGRAARLIQLAAEADPDGAPFTAVPLPGGASNRAYWRLTGRRRSLVAMVLPQDAAAPEEAQTEQRSAAGEPPSFVPELPFLNVRRYLDRLAVRVPALVADASPRGVLLLEDLGDMTLERALVERPFGLQREALYRLAVDRLADLRVKAEARPDATCLAFGRTFEEQLYRWELDHYLYWGFAARLAGEPTPAEAAVFRRDFAAIAARLAALPRGFTHRDFQSRNLMLVAASTAGDPGAPDLAVIDFQDALLAPRQYDLVALLRDSYVPLPAPLVEELLGRYQDRLTTLTGERIDAGAFGRDFDLLTVQRKLKDGGRFVYLDKVKGNPSLLPAVAASFGYVAQALERLPEFAELLGILRARHPEMRD